MVSAESMTKVLLAAQGVLLAALAWPDRPRAYRPSRRRNSSAARACQSADGPEDAQASWVARSAGRTLMAGGLLVSGWGAASLGSAVQASPRPQSGAVLRTSGAYAHLRHPIYAGLLLGAAGRALASGGRRHRRAALGLMLQLHLKAHYEERWLAEVLPGYRSYAARVPALLPHLTRRDDEGPA